MFEWPDWWHWDLEFTPHLFKRMMDRQFNEVDLRSMLDGATGFRRAPTDGRFIIETRLENNQWIVVVEPSLEEKTLVVVTAYMV